MPTLRSALRLAVVALALAAASGCGQKTKDLVDEAKMRLIAKDYEGALAKYDEALKRDAKSYDALWGKAQALGNHGNFKEEQALLEQILKEPELEKKYGANVREALDRSYRTAATNIPKEAEEYLKKAIALDPKSAAKSQLADLFMGQAERATKAGNHADAKIAYDKIAGLDVSKKRKREAANQADLSGFLAFKGPFQAEIDKAKGDFEKAGTLDAANGRFVVEVSADASGDAKAADFEANAEKAAVLLAKNALSDIAWKLHGQPRQGAEPLPFDDTDVTIDSKGWSKPNKTYRVKASAPFDAVTFQVYRLRNPRAPEAPETK